MPRPRKAIGMDSARPSSSRGSSAARSAPTPATAYARSRTVIQTAYPLTRAERHSILSRGCSMMARARVLPGIPGQDWSVSGPRGTADPTSGRSDVQDRATEFLPSGSAGDEAGNAPYELVRQRVQALISAARDLSDTCADLADALRPLPGQDEPGGHDFGRLRAERTAALLDEAASAARGTLGLLHSAYSALERQMGRPPAPEAAPVPRGGLSTWPDAFVELPPRTFAVEEGAGAVPAARCTEPPPGEGVWRSPEARTGAGLGGPGSRPEAVEWAADAGHREAAGWSADTSPADTSPADTSPTDTRPADTGRVDTRPADDGHATAAPAAVDHGPTDHEPTDHGRT